MAARASKRRRLLSTSANEGQKPRLDPADAATNEDRDLWGGWCEIESEPAFFNVMLRRFGVKGVKVQEVVSLDRDMLQFLPRPVYGLVFLFRWIDDNAEKYDSTCPSEIWFANQTVNNACATVALLNIVNNIPNVDLGDQLQTFKDFTSDLSPALKGDAIGNFQFVKQIHNCFARKMDMLNGDLQLMNDMHESKRKRKSAKKSEEFGNAYHFNAFLPKDGKLWKLDGLEPTPCCLGELKDNDWLSQLKPDLEARMAAYEGEQIEFTMLSLVEDPIVGLKDLLAQQVNCLNKLATCLETLDHDWKSFILPEDGDLIGHNGFPTTTILGPNSSYLLHQKDLDDANITETMKARLAGGSLEDFMAWRKELVQDQAGVRMSIQTEIAMNHMDDEKAASRYHDFGPAVQTWIRFHQRKALVQNIIESV